MPERLGKTSSSSQDASKRLKPARVRSRASRACDTCKVRKTRCSGKYPCTHCSRLGLDCSYTAVYRRGRVPSLELDTGEDATYSNQSPSDAASQSNDQCSVQRSENVVPPSPASMANGVLAGRGTAQAPSTTQSRLGSPEPAHTDCQGHYVGPASGASFVMRVQRKLNKHPSEFSSDTSIFTFGDLPLSKPKSRALILPPRSEFEALVSRYFEFVAATKRFTHQPTVRLWVKEMYETNGAMADPSTADSKAALLFMVCANALTYPLTPDKVDTHRCAQFFAAAEDHLVNEEGNVRLTSVQARLMQCFFLLSHSRINHCWSLFGTTAHLMLALGIHRKSRNDRRTIDYVDRECRKRTFWCAYTLDIYLSAALGRPRVFHDDDIDQELPACVSDEEISLNGVLHGVTTNRQSIASGMVAHVKLSRIVARVLRDMYSIRPISTPIQAQLAKRYGAELDDWRHDVLPLMVTDGIDPSLLQPIVVRQQNVLNFAYWHAQILIYRPFLLKHFARLSTLDSASKTTQSAMIEKNIEKCIGASMSVVEKVDQLSRTGKLYSTFWFTHYFTFCAVVMLYVHCIQRRNTEMDTYMPMFRAATMCQLQVGSVAAPGSLAHRYATVIQELRSELLRLNSVLLNHIMDRQNYGDETVLVLEGDAALWVQYGNSELVPAMARDVNIDIESGLGGASLLSNDEGLAFPQESPNSSILHLTGWDRFDSLVSGGIGSLDFMMATDEDVNIGAWNSGANDY